jgi:hypothetical protein
LISVIAPFSVHHVSKIAVVPEYKNIHEAEKEYIVSIDGGDLADYTTVLEHDTGIVVVHNF